MSSVSSINDSLSYLLTQVASSSSATKSSSSSSSTSVSDSSSTTDSTANLSNLSKLVSKLQTMEKTDPAKAKEVLNTISEKLKKSAEDAGSGTAASQMLTQASKDFSDAAESGDLSVLAAHAQGSKGPQGPPPPGGMPPSSSTDSDSDTDSTTSTSSTSSTSSTDTDTANAKTTAALESYLKSQQQGSMQTIEDIIGQAIQGL